MTKRNNVLTLDTRPAKIGAHINTRTEKHGEDDVPACDIPLAGIMLEAHELDALVGDGAFAALFRKSVAPQPEFDEPAFPSLRALVLREKFAACAVTISVDASDLIELDDCKIRRVKLQPLAGGMVELAVQVQATPYADQIAALVAALNRPVTLHTLTFGKVAEKSDKQPDLPMDHGQSDEPHTNEDDDEAQDEAA